MLNDENLKNLKKLIANLGNPIPFSISRSKKSPVLLAVSTGDNAFSRKEPANTAGSSQDMKRKGSTVPCNFVVVGTGNKSPLHCFRRFTVAHNNADVFAILVGIHCQKGLQRSGEAGDDLVGMTGEKHPNRIYVHQPEQKENCLADGQNATCSRTL